VVVAQSQRGRAGELDVRPYRRVAVASYTRIALWLAVCSALLPAARGQEPAAKPKAKVEFRWLEGKPVKGLTEDWGVPVMCGPVLAYPHTKSVLTGKDIAEARLGEADFSSSGLPSKLYMVSFRLTEQARKTLVAECGDQQERMLVVLVDGRSWGMRCFRKAEAADFEPQAGFLSSRTEAERIIAACK
jgi:hypothetical protein